MSLTAAEGKENTTNVQIPIHGNENETLQKKFLDQITQKILQPAYIGDLKSNFRSRLCWRSAGRVFYWTSNTFVLISCVCSFMQLQAHDSFSWSIGAGVSNVIALILLHYGTEAKKEETMITRDLNEVLKSLGLHPFPEENNESFTNTVFTIPTDKDREF
jgi:hypothetical protein